MRQSDHPHFHDHSEEIREFAREWHKVDIEAKQNIWQTMYSWLAINYKTLSVCVAQLAALFYVLALVITH
jgi:hypothetical protein